jgi:hypothetical protein
MNRFLTFAAVAALGLFTLGCGQPAAPNAAPAATSSGNPAKPAAGEHPAHGAGPHGGTLTDWGGGAYHVEFTVDHDKKEATVYVLGSDEKSPSPIKTKNIHIVVNDPMTELDLKAKPLEGEAEGTSSRFVGTHDTFGIVKEYAGTISGEVESTPYTGEFKEEPAK